jgi:hypothetical protein
MECSFAVLLFVFHHQMSVISVYMWAYLICAIICFSAQVATE